MVPPAFVRLRQDATARLRLYRPLTCDQAAARAEFLEHLGADAGAVWRDGPAAHLSAGVLVLSADRQQVLLTHHRKGDAWFHLGGHLEAGDADLASAALREGVEESGIAALDLRPGILQLSAHDLTAAYGRCQRHLDVRYLALAPTGARPQVSEESYDVRWWPVGALPPTAGADLPELVAAARR